MKSVQRCKAGTVIFVLGILVWTAVAAAQETESVPRRLFEAMGILRYVDLPAGRVQINDRSYQLAANMKWYGTDPEKSLNQQVVRAVNSRVGYIVDQGKKPPTVKAIWILPSEGR